MRRKRNIGSGLRSIPKLNDSSKTHVIGFTYTDPIGLIYECYIVRVSADKWGYKEQCTSDGRVLDAGRGPYSQIIENVDTLLDNRRYQQYTITGYTLKDANGNVTHHAA